MLTVKEWVEKHSGELGIGDLISSLDVENYMVRLFGTWSTEEYNDLINLKLWHSMSFRNLKRLKAYDDALMLRQFNVQTLKSVTDIERESASNSNSNINNNAIKKDTMGEWEETKEEFKVASDSLNKRLANSSTAIQPETINQSTSNNTDIVNADSKSNGSETITKTEPILQSELILKGYSELGIDVLAFFVNSFIRTAFYYVGNLGYERWDY